MKYLQYLKNVCSLRQYRLAFHVSDLLIAAATLVLIFLWHTYIDVMILNFDRSSIIFFLCLFLLSHLFWAVNSVSKIIHNVIFYKIIGFRNIDVFLLVLHSFFFSSIVISIFIGLAYSKFFEAINPAIIPLIFLLQTASIYGISFIVRRLAHNAGYINKHKKRSSVMFSNKYLSFLMKDLSEIYRYPILVLNHIFIAVCIGAMVFFKLNYMIGFYIICALHAGICDDSYRGDGDRQLLFLVLRISRYHLFKHKLFVSVTFNLVGVLLYSLLHVMFVQEYSIMMLVLFPVVILNAFAQHVSLGIICCKRFPFNAHRFSSMDFAAWWLVTAIPVVSFPLYGYTYLQTRKLRKESYCA